MAWRFPDVLPVDGDVLHVSHWNDNIDVYSSELNGFLDRDNLRKDIIKRSMVRRNAFVKVFYNADADTYGPSPEDPENDFDIPMRTTAWSSFDGSETIDKMPSVEFSADTDGWVECDFHASYQWREPADPPGGSQAWFKHNADTTAFQYSGSGYPPFPVVYPRVHAEFPGLTAETPQSVQDDWEDFFHQWNPYATDPVWVPTSTGSYAGAGHSGAGAPSCKHFNGGFAEKPSDDDCVAFRITVDGITVAETGWLSIGLYRNGVYLTAAAPVSAGRHTIKTEVRAARVSKMQATASVLAASETGLTSVNPISEDATRVPKMGAKCRVRGRALTVVYRKR